MRRTIAAAVIAVASLSVACGGDAGREFATYYDPEGFFSTNLPAANTIEVTPPQTGASGPGLLTGVIAQPPQPSPSAGGAFGGAGLLASAPASDLTIYEAFAFTTDSFDDLDAMALYFLTGDAAIDVDLEEPMELAGSPGRLVVGTARQGGQETAGIAAAMTLGEDGTGYLVAVIFPPGEWEQERGDFLEVVGSFAPGVPPGVETFDLPTQGT